MGRFFTRNPYGSHFLPKKSLHMGQLVWRKILKNGYPFWPKSPLKMGMGFEARAAHLCPTKIWVPPPPEPGHNLEMRKCSLSLILLEQAIVSQYKHIYLKQNKKLITILFHLLLQSLYFSNWRDSCIQQHQEIVLVSSLLTFQQKPIITGMIIIIFNFFFFF